MKSNTFNKQIDNLARLGTVLSMLLLFLPGRALAGDVPLAAEHTVDENFGGATSVYAADMDGDGDLDILGTARDDDDVTWWENTAGDGSAWSEHTVDGSFDGARSVYAADVDGDGDPDILGTARDGDAVAWWENTTGDGDTWNKHIVSGTVDGAFSVYAADIDGDGDLDILGTATEAHDILWWENTAGDGSAWNEHSITGSLGYASSVYAADVDGDGDLDVLGTALSDDDIVWWENTAGDGSAWNRHMIDGDFDGAFSAYVADVDGDGDLDVLGAADYADDITWWENTDGDGSSWSERLVDGAFDGAFSVYAADIDGDGDLDVLGAACDASDITWWENGTIHRSAFYPPQARSVIATNADMAHVAYAADVDGDGDLDILSASEGDDKIAWYENQGGSPPAFAPHVITTNADAAFCVYAADIDDDGDVDVLSASENDDKIAWYENGGGSPPTFTLHVIATDADGARFVYAADMDGDGDIDVLSISQFDDEIVWYENGEGSPPSFTPHVITTSIDGGRSVYAADMDSDGDMDVLSASYKDDQIAWYENQGGSPLVFASHIVTTAADAAHGVHAADMDGDGDLDVLSASWTDNTVAWYENQGGSLAFARHVLAPDMEHAAWVYAADMDSDGDLDVLSASEGDDTVAWYENQGGSPPAFTPHVITTNADGAWSVQASDIDGDGDLDVLSASQNDDTIAWYENRGGQFVLATTDTAPTTMIVNEQDDVLQIVAAHRGRSGDTDVELATLKLLFEESAGDPLTTAEANSLIENVRIYRDNGSSSFESGADTLVTTVGTLSLIAGTQTIVFTDGDPNVRIAFGVPVTYFVVVELAVNAMGQPFNQFQVTHVTESGSTAEDSSHDIPLSLEYAANVPSGVVTVHQIKIYLPSALRNNVSYWEGPWESEDNDSYLQANGALYSGKDYYGYPDDAKDYFSIYLRTGGEMTIDLSNHTGGGVQLHLFYQSVDNRIAYVWAPPYHIEHTGSTGWYYIYIYTASNYNSTTPYTLQVTYP